MKIEATCETCRRTFLLDQIGPDSDSPGRCPFCGARFARHYNVILIETVDEAERAADNFVQTMARLQSMETGFHIDLEGVLQRVQEQIRANDPHTSAPK
jgi:hypothetical protein